VFQNESARVLYVLRLPSDPKTARCLESTWFVPGEGPSSHRPLALLKFRRYQMVCDLTFQRTLLSGPLTLPFRVNELDAARPQP
jgi:hypothetical protein